ncbi:MAG: hypothetical protein ABIJ53_04880 [Verrucomicrobiota bacterium]
MKNGKESLLIVANLGPDNAAATLRLNAPAMGLQADRLIVADVGKGEWIVNKPVALKDGVLTLAMPETRSKGSLRFLKVTAD